jgi:hypothetical protein
VLGNLFKKRSKKGRKEEDDDVDEWLHGGDKQAASISSRESQESQMEDAAKREKEEAQKREDQRRQGQQKQLHQQREREWEREAQQKSGNGEASLSLRPRKIYTPAGPLRNKTRHLSFDRMAPHQNQPLQKMLQGGKGPPRQSDGAVK